MARSPLEYCIVGGVLGWTRWFGWFGRRLARVVVILGVEDGLT